MSEQPTTIEAYLERLRAELAGSDPALVQDALYDAQEYAHSLRAELTEEFGNEASEGHVVLRLIEKFGTPAEVAEAYRADEVRVVAALAPPPPIRRVPGRVEGIAAKFFGVLVDPRAYGSLLYMFLSLFAGIVYFTWVMTGLSISIGLGITIIGLPFVLLFLATVRVLSLVEGRIVEALLGVRMPRRPVFADPQGSLWRRIKLWVTDERSWTTIFYMLLMLPVGILYFTLSAVLLSVTLFFFLAPLAQLVFGLPIFNFGSLQIFLPLPFLPLMWLVSACLLLGTLHVARGLGRFHGAIAKAMLVRAAREEQPQSSEDKAVAPEASPAAAGT